jgi:hypothetical protein
MDRRTFFVALAALPGAVGGWARARLGPTFKGVPVPFTEGLDRAEDYPPQTATEAAIMDAPRMARVLSCIEVLDRLHRRVLERFGDGATGLEFGITCEFQHDYFQELAAIVPGTPAWSVDGEMPAFQGAGRFVFRGIPLVPWPPVVTWAEICLSGTTPDGRAFHMWLHGCAVHEPRPYLYSRSTDTAWGAADMEAMDAGLTGVEEHRKWWRNLTRWKLGWPLE